MIILTIIAYLFVYNFPSYAEKQSLKEELRKSLGISKDDNKSYLDDIEKRLKAEKDAFFKCWLDNVKPNSSASHTEVVALYCSNKTGYKP